MKRIRIGKSKIAGRGVFAGENIRKGEFVAVFKGKLIHKEYKTKSDLHVGKTWNSVGRNWWIVPDAPFKFMNHSCSPNLGFKTAQRMYALRDIAKDEELTFDYSTTEYVDFWAIPCSCQSPSCRKVVRAVQYLPPEIYKRYLPYIPRFFRNVYAQYHKREKMRL